MLKMADGDRLIKVPVEPGPVVEGEEIGGRAWPAGAELRQPGEVYEER